MKVFTPDKLKRLLSVTDYFVLTVIFLLVFWYFDMRETPLTVVSVVVVLTFWYLVTTRKGELSKRFYFLDSTVHISIFIRQFLTFTLLLLVLFLGLDRHFLMDRQIYRFLFFFLVVSFLSLGLIRLMILAYRKKHRKDFESIINTILVGNNSFTKLLFTNTDVRANLGIFNYIHLDGDEKTMVTQIRECMRQPTPHKIENIVFCDDSFNDDFYLKVEKIARKEMIRTFIIPVFRQNIFSIRTIDVYNGVPVLRTMNNPVRSGGNRIVKRIFDLVFSLFVIIFILSWLIPLVGVLIWMESPGPIFFKQKRSGLGNRTFTCIKFRSMKMNREADEKMATREDSRITRVGALLRKTSLDEFPQFFNVLRGDMSIVGPRPHMVSQTNLYAYKLDRYMIRHMVKPGITGWAQVMGARGEIFTDEDMKKRVKKDIWYIKNWSFMLDLKIIFLTIVNIFKGDKQAY